MVTISETWSRRALSFSPIGNLPSLYSYALFAEPGLYSPNAGFS
jgi:hypothetical protein